MMFQRTEPDENFKKIHDEERKQGRGYLKIFLVMLRELERHIQC